VGLPRIVKVSLESKSQQVEQTFELFPDVRHFLVDPLLLDLLDPTRANIRNKLVITQG
jgi:hypothetical protein